MDFKLDKAIRGFDITFTMLFSFALAMFTVIDVWENFNNVCDHYTHFLLGVLILLPYLFTN